DVMDHVSYTNTSDVPPASVTLNYTFNDGSPGNSQGPNTPPGAPATATGTATVNITALNDSPALTNLGTTATTNEQTAVVLDATAHVSDVDLDPLNGGNGSYTGASLTIARDGGASTEDTFGFSAAGATFTVNGGNLQVGANVFATFTNTGGTLTINFTSSGTTATSALVNNVLDHITYTNSSDTPPASVLLDYTFNDGSPGNGQGTNAPPGATGIATGSVTVDITAVNDAPTATAPSTHYSATEQTDLSLKNTGLSVNDVDSLGNSETATLTVGEGILTVDAGTSGANVTGSGTSQVTITGTIAA